MMMMMKSTTSIAAFVMLACIAGIHGGDADETVTIGKGKQACSEVRKNQESGFAVVECLTKMNPPPLPSGSPEHKAWLETMGTAGANGVSATDIRVMEKVCDKNKAYGEEASSTMGRIKDTVENVMSSREERDEKKEKKRLLPTRAVMDTVCPIVPHIQSHFNPEASLTRNVLSAMKVINGGIGGWFKGLLGRFTGKKGEKTPPAGKKGEKTPPAGDTNAAETAALLQNDGGNGSPKA